MELFSSEEFLFRSNDEQLLLTTQRVSVRTKEWGQAYNNTIFLEDISSVETRFSSLLSMLVIGIVLIAGGLFWGQSSNGAIFNGACIFGVIALLVYFLSRRHVVRITPDGGHAIEYEIGSMPQTSVDEFIHKLQLAKAVRRQALS